MAPRIRHKQRFDGISGSGPAGSPQAYNDDHEIVGAWRADEIEGLPKAVADATDAEAQARLGADPAAAGALASPNIAPTATYPAWSSGPGDQRAALQSWLDGPGYKRIGSGRRTYRLDGGLVLPVTVDALKLDLGNTVFDCSRMAAQTKVLRASGAKGAARPLFADATKGSVTLAIDPGNLGDLTPGMMVRIGSNAQFDPGSTHARLGELNVIAAVGAPCTLKMPLRDDYAVTDGAFVEPIFNPMSGFELMGGEFYGPEATANGLWGLQAWFMDNPKVSGTRFNYFDYLAVAFHSCMRAEADISVIASRPDTTGYGVSFFDACLGGLARGTFRDVRHAASTNNLVASEWGVVRDVIFRDMHAFYSAPALSGVGGSAFDTHTAAENISFLDCSAQGATGPGLNIECPTATVRGFRSIDSRSTLTAVLCNNRADRPGHYVLNGIVVDGSAGGGLTIQKATGGPQTTFDLSNINIRRAALHCVTLQRVDGGYYGGGVLQPAADKRGVNVTEADRLTIAPFACIGGANSVFFSASVSNSVVYKGADSSTGGISLAGANNSAVPAGQTTQIAVVAAGVATLADADIRMLGINVTLGAVTLDSLAGGSGGQIIAIRPSTNGDPLTIRDGQVSGGNIQTIGSAAQSFTSPRHSALFLNTGAEWIQLTPVAAN